MKEDLDPETVGLLKEFLRASEKQDYERKLDKVLAMLEKSKDWQTEHDQDDKKNYLALEGHLKGVSLRVGLVEQTVKKIQDELDQEKEDTLSGLKAELAKEKEKKEKRQELKAARRYNSIEWIKQNWITILISAASVAIAAYEAFKK